MSAVALLLVLRSKSRPKTFRALMRRSVSCLDETGVARALNR